MRLIVHYRSSIFTRTCLVCSEKVLPRPYLRNTVSNTALVNEILGDHNVDKQMTDSRDDVRAV